MHKPKIYFFIFFLIVSIAILFFIWFGIGDYGNYLSKNNLEDISVEFHGLIFDIILFGIILTVFEKYRSKKEEIKRLNREIRVFATWSQQEGILRKNAAIKELNELGITKLNHYGLILTNTELAHVNLNFSILSGCDFNKTMLNGLKMKEGIISDCSFNGTDFTAAKLRDTTFSNCTFNKIDKRVTNFHSTDLTNTTFVNCDLSYANLIKCTIRNTKFINCNLEGVRVHQYLWLKFLEDDKLLDKKTLEYLKSKYKVVCCDSLKKIYRLSNKIKYIPNVVKRL